MKRSNIYLMNSALMLIFWLVCTITTYIFLMISLYTIKILIYYGMLCRWLEFSCSFTCFTTFSCIMTRYVDYKPNHIINLCIFCNNHVDNFQLYLFIRLRRCIHLVTSWYLQCRGHWPSWMRCGLERYWRGSENSSPRGSSCVMFIYSTLVSVPNSSSATWTWYI